MIEEQKKLSIIVPVYNSEKFLEKCINSLLNQTYKNIEIILVNDGSTDYSLEICKKYSNKYNNILLINQNNLGVSIARNNGLKKSSGYYIGFVDSDDYIEKNMYETLIRNLEDNNVDIAVCNLFFENINGDIIKKYSTKDEVVFYNKILDKMYFDLCYQGYTCNKVYKASLIKNNNIEFDAKKYVLEDDLFNIKILVSNQNIKSLCMNKKLYHYVQRQESVSNMKFNAKKITYLDSRIDEIELLTNNNYNIDFLLADYINVYKKMKILVKHYSININFDKYDLHYHKYSKIINLKNINKKLLIKYLVIKYIPFAYYLKMLIKKEI